MIGRIASQMLGRCAETRLPTALRAPAWRTLGRGFGMQLDEVGQPLTAFPSFGDFFARQLRADARPVAADAAAVVPCDGVCVATGRALDASTVLRVKGSDYTLSELLGLAQAPSSALPWSYWVIYLAPKDYHRVHAPVGGAMSTLRHLPGTYYPVNALGTRWVRGLFVRNERVVFGGQSETAWPWSMTMVGAFGVGSISLTGKLSGCSYSQNLAESPRRLEAADEMAAFRLGSTVILGIAHENRYASALAPGQVVRMGQALLSDVAKPDAGARRPEES